jgi:hypothetical protein
VAAGSFEDLLNDRIRQTDRADGRAAGPARAGLGAAYGFFFVETAAAAPDHAHPGPQMVWWRRAAAGSPACRVSPAAHDPGKRDRANGPDLTRGHDADAPRGVAPGGRPVRRLSRRQREALVMLESLGAPLAEDFTAEELRGAFRALARRYHPDRHPSSSASDRARLCMLFGRAHDAYRLLSPLNAPGPR